MIYVKGMRGIGTRCADKRCADKTTFDYSVEELQNMHLLLRGDKLGLELNCKEGGKTESMNISKKEILQNNIHKNG